MNKRFRFVRLAIVPSSFVAFASGAHAALPAEVSAGLADAATNTAAAAGLVVLIYLGIKGFKWIRSAF